MGISGLEKSELVQELYNYSIADTWDDCDYIVNLILDKLNIKYLD